MDALAASDSEGECTSRVAWIGDNGDWKPWRSASEAGRYACGMKVQTPGYDWWEDDQAMIGLKFAFCKNDDWNTMETVEIAGGDGAYTEW